MKHIPLFLIALAALPAHAQLVNGSFEMNGGPSLEGWSWTCDGPGEGTGGAPGSGAWHATKQPGHFKGCFPSYLYQPIAGAQDGDLYTLSGWVRCDMEEPCIGGYLGLGRLSEGDVAIEDLAGAAEATWTYVTITDTVEIDDGEQAVVVLTAGSIGGPALLNPAHFDGIQLDLVTGVERRNSASIHHYVDAVLHTLSISTGEDRIASVRLFDLTGRALPVTMQNNTSTTVQVDLNGLPQGAYFAQVRTMRSEQTIRFTTW